MAELQSFGNTVGSVDAPAPRQVGGSASDAIGLAGNLLGTATRLASGAADRASQQAEANQNAAVAQGHVFSEDFKRREPLSEAVALGQLTEEQAASFGADEAKSLQALNQAAAQGMGQSVKNALERSVRFQFAAMKNPGAAKKLAEVYGIGNDKAGQDTLDAIEHAEAKQLKANADNVRKLAADEGYDEFLGLTDDAAVIEAWIGSPAAVREREIKQSERSALSQEASIEERAPRASRALALEQSLISKDLSRLEQQYRAATANGNTGTDGNGLSLAEQFSIYAEDKIAQVAVKYQDFPKLIETYAKGIRDSVNARVSGRTKGLATGAAEYAAQVTRPLDYERTKLDIDYNISQIENNNIRTLSSAITLENNIFKNVTEVGKLKDSINNNPASSRYLKEVLDTQVRSDRVPMLLAAADQTNIYATNLLNPREGSILQSVNDATDALVVGANVGMDSNAPALKRAVEALSVSHKNNLEFSPRQAKIIEQSVLGMAKDPTFVKLTQDSPLYRQLAEPIKAGVTSRIVDSLHTSLSEMTTDRVSSVFVGNLANSNENPIALWRKLGPYIIVDKAATNKAGVPQYKLVNNIEEGLSEDDITNMGIALEFHNRVSLRDSDPNEYTLLKNLSGAGSVGDAVTQVVQSNEGLSLGTLDPNRALPNRGAAPAPAEPLTSIRQTR